MKINKKIPLLSILITVFLLSLLFVSMNFLTFCSTSVQASTTTLTGVISAVESGTTSTSSWSAGPIPDPKGTSVSVDIRIDGAAKKSVWGWAVNDINWNPSVLQLTKVTQGNFLTDSGDMTLMIGTSSSLWNNTSGSIEGGLACSDAVSNTAETPDTSGVLATLVFKIVGFGAGSINLADAILYSSGSAQASESTGTQVTANSATVTVLQPPASLIEVFTDRGGTGANPNSGVYGPEDLVQMYALVSYNQAPVANQEVSFSVENSNGSIIDVRVAETNSTGYAYSDYRLPWPNTANPQIEFGNWSITATTCLSDVSINGTVYFTYNYVVSVVNTNGIQLPSIAERGTTVNVNVTIQNIANQPTWSTVSVTIYDAVNTPIGNFLASNNETTGTSTIKASIIIPSWAFIGNATVYVDVLTNTPSQSGVPYCPERTAYFLITS